MATATLVSLEESLQTSYRPDCDFVDGEVLERNLGEREHSIAQREIMFFLRDRYPHLRRRLLPEQRIRVGADRFLIPDVCVTAADAPIEKVLTSPPDLCIEILSPEDRMPRVMARIADFLAMGVPVCWIIDPETMKAWVATHTGLREVADGILRADTPSGTLEMPVNAVCEPAPDQI